MFHFLCFNSDVERGLVASPRFSFQRENWESIFSRGTVQRIDGWRLKSRGATLKLKLRRVVYECTELEGGWMRKRDGLLQAVSRLQGKAPSKPKLRAELAPEGDCGHVAMERLEECGIR